MDDSKDGRLDLTLHMIAQLGRKTRALGGKREQRTGAEGACQGNRVVPQQQLNTLCDFHMT